MNADELAKGLSKYQIYGDDYGLFNRRIQNMLRQQQAEIEALKAHPVKELTDAVVNELWAESQEDGIAMQQGFTTQQHYFAYLILRKASEK